ncbi:CopG family transcriptional regulator [Halosimplex halobium]|uniref:CopG family transcriptional regulator n=1 Tax=Halosimplex halobium TaxID=3396618 RepID=UPI003F54FFFB
MLQRIEEEKERHGMSRAEYIRHCVRQANDSPFDTPDEVLCRDENYENGRQNEGAA